MTQKPTSAAAASAADEQRDPELAARKFECVEAAHRACREATACQPLWTMIPNGCRVPTHPPAGRVGSGSGTRLRLRAIATMPWTEAGDLAITSQCRLTW